jgi:hypothetical protein
VERVPKGMSNAIRRACLTSADGEKMSPLVM